jgi:hypothetical protein
MRSIKSQSEAQASPRGHEKTALAVRREASLAATAFQRLEGAASKAMADADKINGAAAASLKLVAASGHVRGFIQTRGGVSVQFDETGAFAVDMAGSAEGLE